MRMDCMKEKEQSMLRGIEYEVAELLQERHFTISTIESCTGGLIAGRLVNVAGVSDVFMEGYITYSNEAKHKIAGVRRKTLEKHGAVSPQTAKQMAKGLAKATGADVTISVTGIAGPDGGTPEKPVGLVYMACCVQGDTTVQECRFQGSRAEIREASVQAALGLVKQCLEKAQDTD